MIAVPGVELISQSFLFFFFASIYLYDFVKTCKMFMLLTTIVFIYSSVWLQYWKRGMLFITVQTLSLTTIFSKAANAFVLIKSDLS